MADDGAGAWGDRKCNGAGICARGRPCRGTGRLVTGHALGTEPTINNIAIVWPLTGDDDADGVVSVRFRALGAPEWRTGMPLRRVPAGRMPKLWHLANRHAGSVFDVQVATTYELELTLADPDGARRKP